MRVVSRFREPTPESVERIRACAQAISPDDGLDSWYRTYVHGQTDRIALDLDIVREFVPTGSTTVDVGALPFLLTLAMEQEGLDVVAIDLDPERFAGSITKNGLRVLRCDIETEALPCEDGSADALIFNEVLEHLRINPVFALKEARRVLKPGGMLLLSTPNLRSLNGLWNLIVHGRSYALKGDVYAEYENLEKVGHMGHVREYAPGDVRLLLKRVGFEVEALVFWGRQPSAPAELVCRVMPQLRRFVTYVARAT